MSGGVFCEFANGHALIDMVQQESFGDGRILVIEPTDRVGDDGDVSVAQVPADELVGDLVQPGELASDGYSVPGAATMHAACRP